MKARYALYWKNVKEPQLQVFKNKSARNQWLRNNKHGCAVSINEAASVFNKTVGLSKSDFELLVELKKEMEGLK